MPGTQTGHVFISYSRRDDVVMRRVVKYLREQGILAWVDNEKLVPGTPIWEYEIEKAIRGAFAIVVILSPDAKKSEWVLREITLADQFHKRVFPILVGGTDEDSVPLRLITRQFVDIRKDEPTGLKSLSTAISFYSEELTRLEEERAAAEREAARLKMEREAAERAARDAKAKAEAEKQARHEAERLARKKAEEEWLVTDELKAKRITKQKVEEERIAKTNLEEERSAKENAKDESIVPQIATYKKIGQSQLPFQQQSIFKWAIIGIIGLCVVGAGAWGISFLANINSPPTESPVNETPGTFESLTPPESNPGDTQDINEIESPNNIQSPDPSTFVYATSVEPEILDPALNYFESAGGEVIQNVYETLIFYDGEATDKFVPLLAESWEISGDGAVYTFKIRSGVKFHEGQDLTASDVAYTFQRGLLMGGYSGPQWLLAEPFFGAGKDDVTYLVDEGASVDDRESLQANDSTTLVTACGIVKSKIVADDSSGTVTMTLAQSWGPFIPTIAQPWGSILDKDWAIENGAWDGSCNTWQNYYAEPSETDPLRDITNGTGPFMLNHWISGEELVMVRNENYWRAPAKLERIVVKYIDEWSTRFAMMQAGDADVIAVLSESNSQMDALVGEDCIFDVAANEYTPCEVINDSLPFRRYIGQPTLTHTDMFLTFDINPASNYVGSGQLDGNGIPLDFFSDVHIRKAFAYCFDWEIYISETYDGEAVQTPVIPLAGMPGYQADMPVYSYNPTKCEEEFKLADVDKDGIPAGEDTNDVWSTGFRLQALFNEGNDSREVTSEILARNLAELNDKFLVETVGLPWPTYLRVLRNAEGPYYISGWVEDIHDAHNWYQPYVAGIYAERQRMDSDLQATFQELVNAGVAETDPVTRSAIYAELNELFYNEVPTILLATATKHNFEQRWVFGRVSNPIFAGIYYYTIFKQ